MADFELSEEQQGLRSVSRDLLADHSAPSQVRAALGGPDVEAKLWTLGTGLGWTGLAVPESELPVRRPNPRPRIPGLVQRRSDALRAWRVEAAKRVELDPGVIFPQRLSDRLAQDPPTSIQALAQVEGVGRWRAELFGAELMRRLA